MVELTLAWFVEFEIWQGRYCGGLAIWQLREIGCEVRHRGWVSEGGDAAPAPAPTARSVGRVAAYAHATEGVEGGKSCRHVPFDTSLPILLSANKSRLRCMGARKSRNARICVQE